MRGRRRILFNAPASRLVLIAAAATLAAGCSNGNIRLAGAPLFAANNTGQPMALAPIESSPLAPPTVGTGAQVTTSPSLRAKGYTVENAPIVEVGAGDTAQTLSQGFGIPVPIILEANGLIVPADVRQGQRLVMPVKASPAIPPSAVASAPQSLGAPATTLNQQAAERRHRVAPGETLATIAASYGVTSASIQTLNGLPPGGVLPGQMLRVPPAAAPAPAAVASLGAPATATPATPAPVTPAPQAVQTPQAPAAAAQPVSTPPAATTKAVADTGGTGFRWPVRGRIIAGFGKQADGARNDGINLAVPAGTPVRAAESGTVIYAGNELEGYGNLILVQHEDNWVSAYAHNETLKVSRGETVARGQPIAAAGKSGSVDQ
ncbi:MAG: peptidoglycan DD-metalloendopeptidase family protein, partial [Pseudomonadota bacterium]